MATIRRIGNSLGVILPAHAAKQLFLKAGTQIRLLVHLDHIVIQNACMQGLSQSGTDQRNVAAPQHVEEEKW